MIFRHGCGGDCGCECIPCNHCNEDDEDLLPETITVEFTFPSSAENPAYGLCGKLWGGKSIVLVKDTIANPSGCPACRYTRSVCGLYPAVSLRFFGIGLSVEVAFAAGPCAFVLNYVGEAENCLTSPLSFQNSEGVSVTISPGGEIVNEIPFAMPVRPTSATVSLGYGGVTLTETANPLPVGSFQAGSGLFTYGPSPSVGLAALLIQQPANLAMNLVSTCPFHWAITLTAYQVTFFTSPTGGDVWRDIGFYGEIYSTEIPTLEDFMDADAFLPLSILFHVVRFGSDFNMLVPYEQWTPFDQFVWADAQAKGWLPPVEEAANAPNPTATWELGF